MIESWFLTYVMAVDRSQFNPLRIKFRLFRGLLLAFVLWSWASKSHFCASVCRDWVHGVEFGFLKSILNVILNFRESFYLPGVIARPLRYHLRCLGVNFGSMWFGFWSLGVDLLTSGSRLKILEVILIL